MFPRALLDDDLDEKDCESPLAFGCLPRREGSINLESILLAPIRPKSKAGEKPAISLPTSIVGVVMALLCDLLEEDDAWLEEDEGCDFFLLGTLAEETDLCLTPLS